VSSSTPVTQSVPASSPLDLVYADLRVEVDRLRAREDELIVEVGRWRDREEVWEIRNASRSRSQSISHHGPARSRRSRLGEPSQLRIDEGQGESEDPRPGET